MRDLLHRVEAVEVRDGNLVDAVDHRGIAGGHGVEPAAAAGTAGGRSVLAAHGVEHVGNLVVLGCEWAFADAGRICLHDAHDLVHAMRRHAGARAGTAGGRVRRGHVRVRAVVEVEEGALGAFERMLLPAEIALCR